MHEGVSLRGAGLGCRASDAAVAWTTRKRLLHAHAFVFPSTLAMHVRHLQRAVLAMQMHICTCLMCTHPMMLMQLPCYRNVTLFIFLALSSSPSCSSVRGGLAAHKAGHRRRRLRLCPGDDDEWFAGGLSLSSFLRLRIRILPPWPHATYVTAIPQASKHSPCQAFTRQ
jgi:hypothetical protein